MLQVHDLRSKSCNECNKKFVGAQQLRTHMKSHRKIVCEICLDEVAKDLGEFLPIIVTQFINFLKTV